MEKKNYIIGYDLSEKYAQISYCDTLGNEGEVLQIPVCLSKREGANQWYYGEDALRYKAKMVAGSRPAFFVRNILSKALKEENVTVEGEAVVANALLTLFVRKTLVEIEAFDLDTMVSTVVLCVPVLNKRMLTMLQVIRERVLSDVEHVFFVTKEECLSAYLMSRPKELWGYEVDVFDFSDGYFRWFKSHMNQKSRPIVTTVETEKHEDICFPDEDLTYEKRSKLEEENDAKMYALIDAYFSGKIVTSVYLNGKVFEKEWYKNTLKLLCRNRKVFGGSNLFSKGACILGEEKSKEDGKAPTYLYLGKEKLHYHVGIVVQNQMKQCHQIYLEGGTNWYEAKNEFVFIPGEDSFLPIYIVSLDGMQERVVPLSLPCDKKRSLKSYKFLCQLSMISQKELRVVVEDLGFGSFFAPSGKHYEEIIDLGGTL